MSGSGGRLPGTPGMRFSPRSWRRELPPLATNGDSEEFQQSDAGSPGRSPIPGLENSSFERRADAAERRNAKRLDRQSRRRALKSGVAVGRVVRTEIIGRDGRQCYLCGKTDLLDDELHLDHVIPLAKGGAHSPKNVRVACASCNLSKGASMHAAHRGTLPSSRP